MPSATCNQQRYPITVKHKTYGNTTDLQPKMTLPLDKFGAVLIMKMQDVRIFGDHRVLQKGWTLPRRGNCPAGRE